MPSISQFTLNDLLSQTCQIERDSSTLDSFGGEVKAKREVVGESRCRFFWWRERASGGGRTQEYATPERTIHFAGGGAVLPLGTDIEAGDWISVVHERGKVVAQGPMRVVGMQEWEDHIDVELMRP